MKTTKTILILISSVIVMSCVSPAERFAKRVNQEMIETDRNELIGEIRGFNAPDFKNDSPVWNVSVDTNCVTILIQGEFSDKDSLYQYFIKEHYLIDIPAKGYYHFCPDTISISNASGGKPKIIPPYN